jgi:hypothetical protein
MTGNRAGASNADPALLEVLSDQPESEVSNLHSFGDILGAANALGLHLTAHTAAALVRSNQDPMRMSEQLELIARFRAWRAIVDSGNALDTFDLALGFLCGAGLDHTRALEWCQVLSLGEIEEPARPA